jgi:hypothetical protein
VFALHDEATGFTDGDDGVFRLFLVCLGTTHILEREEHQF